MRLILATLTVITLLFSCKKKTSEDPNTNPTFTVKAYGSMSTVLFKYYNGNTLSGIDSSAYAYFFTNPSNPSASFVSGGTVSYNGLLLQNSSNNYSSYSLNIHQPNSVWSISGSADVPSINYTISPNYPVFNGNAQLPDSFSISGSLSINLSGISNNTNGILVKISDNTNNLSKNLSPTQTSCVFSALELSVLQPNSMATISVNMSNYVSKNYGGKGYTFESSLQHMKRDVKIKP